MRVLTVLLLVLGAHAWAQDAGVCDPFGPPEKATDPADMKFCASEYSEVQSWKLARCEPKWQDTAGAQMLASAENRLAACHQRFSETQRRETARTAAETAQLAMITFNEEDQSRLNDRGAMTVALSAILCDQRDQSREARGAISSERAGAKIGGTVDLQQLHDAQTQARDAEDYSRTILARLKHLKAKPIACTDQRLATVVYCMTNYLNDRRCLTEPTMKYVRLANHIQEGD